MSIGKHRQASALLHNTQNIRICMGKKTYRFCNLRKWKDFNKKQLTLHKMGVTFLLCAGPWAYLWLFMGCSVNSFLSMYKVYQGWGFQRSGPTDPPKENSCKFAPTAPIASKFRQSNTREFFFLFVIFLQDAFAPRANQRLPMSANLFIWSHQQNRVLLKAGPRPSGPRPVAHCPRRPCSPEARRPGGPAARWPSPDFPQFFCPAVNPRASTDLHRVWACKMDDGEFEFVYHFNHLNPCFCLLHVVQLRTFPFSVHSSLYRNR